MNRMLKNVAMVLPVAMLSLAGPLRADARIPVVSDELTKTECSACHMAFQPAFLPARSWKTIMATLDNHFGEDASLDEATRVAIEDYLVANAADAPGSRTSWMLRGVGEYDVILRISEMPWWVREHRGEVSQRSWNRAGSKSNCTACHRGAERGYFDDD